MKPNFQVYPSDKFGREWDLEFVDDQESSTQRRVQSCKKESICAPDLVLNHLLIKVGRLLDLLVTTFRFQHYTTVPVWPRDHSKVGALNALLFEPFIMSKKSLAQSDTSIHLEHTQSKDHSKVGGWPKFRQDVSDSLDNVEGCDTNPRSWTYSN